MKRILAVLALALVGLAGCAGPETAEPPQTTPTPVSTPSPSPEVTSPAGVTPSASADAVANMAQWTLSTAGWGPVRIGSPIPSSLAGQTEPGWECIGPKILDAPGGTEQMEVFAGADDTEPIFALHILNPAITTDSGMRVGDSTSKLQQTFPGIAPLPDQSVEVYAAAEQPPYAMFFEIDENSSTITHISVQRMEDFFPFTFQVCGSP